MAKDNEQTADASQNSTNKKEISGSFIKGFASGVFLSHINKNLILGLLIGALAGCYVQQNYAGIPDVSKTATDWINSIKDSIKK